jgi:hypothetical protein
VLLFLALAACAPSSSSPLDTDLPAEVSGAWVWLGPTAMGSELDVVAPTPQPWVFGRDRLALRRVGGVWTEAHAPAYGDVLSAAVAPDGAVLVGVSDESIRRWNGASWEVVAQPIAIAPVMLAVDARDWYAAAGGTVTSIGTDSVLRHDLPGYIHALWSPVAGEVWAATDVGIARITWDDEPTWLDTTPVTALCGASAEEAWAFGAGVAGHTDGVTWMWEDVPQLDGTPTGAWCRGTDDIWVAGADFGTYGRGPSFLAHRGSSGWTGTSMPGTMVGALAGRSDVAVIVGHRGFLQVWDGAGWVDEGGFRDSFSNLREVGDELWARTHAEDGSSGWHRWGPNGWDPLALPEDTNDVWGTPDDLYVTITGGTVHRRLDGSWDEVLAQSNVIPSNLWGSGDRLWAMGYGAGIWAMEDGSWTFHDLTGSFEDPVDEDTGQWPPEVHFNAVSGSGPEDVWAVGERGLITHWDGATWRVLAGGDPFLSFRDVALIGPGDAWMVGDRSDDAVLDGPHLYHWDGTRAVDAGREVSAITVHDSRLWALDGGSSHVFTEGGVRTFPLPGAGNLGVMASAGGGLWAAGYYGAMASWEPGE